MAALTTVAAKIPLTLRDEAETVAGRQNLTLSTLIRRLLERAVAEAATGEPVAEVEAATRAEIGAFRGVVSETRVAAALEMARRLDRDPGSGALHSRELRALLDELGGRRRDDFTPLDVLQACRVLRLAGYRLVEPGGRVIAEGWTS